MIKMNLAKITALSILFTIILSIHGIYTLLQCIASQNQLELISYSYKSSAGTSGIYPGSKNVELNVIVQSLIEEDIIISAACLQLPEGFTISRGSTQCSPPYTPNGTTYVIIKQGDVITFKYRFDVESTISPGKYYASITVYYSEGGSEQQQTIEGIEIYVDQHPELYIDVIDWYWSPDAYPGSQNIYLYIVLKNVGDSAIVQAEGVAKLQSDIFTPSNVRFRIPSLEKYATTSISLGPLSISPNAIPDISYRVELVINATMRTDDNVIYTGKVTKTFSITLSSAPLINLAVLDYGFESTRIVEDAIQTQFYVTIINKDFKTVRSITAYFTILSPESSFTNRTKNAVNIYRQVLNYGDIATLHSPPMIIGTTDRVNIELKLIIFGEDNGAEFWSENIYYFTVTVNKPYINLVITDVYWLNGEIYPGSENARLAIILENYDVVNVEDVIALIELPSNFYPNIIRLTDIDIPRGSRSTLVFSGISISNRTKPGAYKATLNISGIAVESSGTFYRFQNNYIFTITISAPPNRSILNVIEHGWTSKKAYINSINSRLYVYFMVSEPGIRIQNPIFMIYLPKQMIFQSINRSISIPINGAFGYGQAIYLEVPNIDIVTSDEGVYPVIIKLKALVIGVEEFWHEETYTILLPIYSPRLNLTLIDSGWWNKVSSSITSGAAIYLTFQSLNIDTLNSLIIQIELDGVNAKFVDGRNTSIYMVTNPINYGNVFTAIFTDVEINSLYTNISIKIIVTGTIYSYGMYYTAREYFLSELALLSELKALVINAIHTQYSGSHAPLLPTARNIFINIDLINIKTYPIAWIKPKTSYIPNGIRVNDISGSCLYGIPAAGTCTLTLNIDIDPVAQSGNYSIAILIEYAIQNRDSIAIYRDNLEIPISIASYDYYRPNIRPITWFWGIQTPIRALEGQRNVPLTLIIMNEGPYTVSGVEVVLNSTDKDVMIINGKAFCTPILNVGGSCSVTFYVDLANTSLNHIKFDANIYYLFTLYGANIKDNNRYSITLAVDKSASGKGLDIIDWGWINNWPAYPNTSNATYFVTVVNRWPYRVSGVKLMLSLPEGFTSKGFNEASSYISGPINSLQQFTATFSINIGNVKPGKYNATLIIEYIVESGTPNTAFIDKHQIKLLVNDPSDSISLISTQWIGIMPEPNSYGAILAITIRNNYNPSVKGSILELYLPQGFTHSASNQSYAKIPATSINIMEQLQTPSINYQRTITNYISYISQLLQQQGNIQQVFGYGDLMYFYVKLNILIENPGTYTAMAYLNFIDHWNCVRKIPILIEISVLGSTKVIDIITPIKVKVVNGTSVLNLGISNIGSAPLYNIYVYIVPYTSILLPDGNVKYVDILPPNNIVNITYNLIYNPVAIAMGTAQTYMRYMSVPFGVTVIFRDISGFMQYFNTSLSILLEPFIDLKLEDVKASVSGDILKVTGTIVNYGIATARSVEAKVDIDGEITRTLVGDIDPASQSVFRIETKIKHIPNNVLLIIVYRDEYYIERTLEQRIGIAIEQSTPTYTQTPIQTFQLNHIIVIIIVAIFLSVMALIFYRYIRKTLLQQSVDKG